MDKKLTQEEYEKFLDEYDREINEAFTTPEGTQKFFEEIDDFLEEVSEEELSEALNTMLYSGIKNMLTWSEEKIKSHLSTAPVSVLKEYLRCIKANEEFQSGNDSKIALLKELAKQNEIDKSKIPHDINQVNLCGWIARDSITFKNSEIAYGCKFTIVLHWDGRFDTDGKPYVSFIDIEYRGKNAIAISPYLIKGKRVAVSGKLVQHRWEKDGVKQSCIVIAAKDVVFFNDERNLELSSIDN
jgi:hypothetical protein